jgi:hypothetical protein
VRNPDGEEFNIDLIQLEDALQGTLPGHYYFLPKSGRIIFISSEEMDDESEEPTVSDDEEALPIDALDSRTQFGWMEDFISTVHSIAAQNALRDALRHKKPFRNFKDALMEFPQLRKKWFEFEALKVKTEAVDLLESLDFEILEVVDSRPRESTTEEIDPAENVPLTVEEHESILRGAWQVEAKGGRSQLSLLLKGSKDKSVLKHRLDQSPVYGKLSYLTIEEIENRIDQLIRSGELRTEFFGDFPLIVLTDQSWLRIQPWAHEYECHLAASADARTLNEILNDWRNRRRDEQHQLLEAITLTERESARRVLQAWHALSGKEMRSRIESTLSTLA